MLTTEVKMLEDFKKVQKVLNHPDNKESHKKVLSKYLFLFLNKWKNHHPLQNKKIKNYINNFYTY